MIRRHWLCACPAGLWPACGVARRCGAWEFRARAAGALVEEIDGLPHGYLFSAPGKPTIIYLPTWLGGKMREAEIARLLGELAVRVDGERAVQARLDALLGPTAASAAD